MKPKRSDATRRAFPRRIRRVALCLLLPLVLSLSLLSCGGDRIEPADEGEAIAAAERLIGEAEVWIRLFYTEGGMPILEGGRQNGRYREVDGAEMERLGFRRLSDLKDYERSIFSPSVCEAQDAALFTGGGGAWRAALIENTEIDYSTGEKRTVFVCFFADPDELPRLPSEPAAFDFSAASVTENAGDRVKIGVPVSGTGASEGKRTVKTLDLCRIEGKWFLDNYPNVVFPAEGN